MPVKVEKIQVSRRKIEPQSATQNVQIQICAEVLQEIHSESASNSKIKFEQNFSGG